MISCLITADQCTVDGCKIINTRIAGPRIITNRYGIFTAAAQDDISINLIYRQSNIAILNTITYNNITSNFLHIKYNIRRLYQYSSVNLVIIIFSAAINIQCNRICDKIGIIKSGYSRIRIKAGT
ncbi:hypothetical protein SDC9_167689 [bioreactor metagenome]|uniref:Uncharacterized protein n=1 Tax=bioreactor metagenome TaxID=1076179 RepID=A0A645G0G8_9ZZZZ